MIGETVKWRRWHKSNTGRERITYTGQVEAESNNVLVVRITAVEFHGRDIPAWGYDRVHKGRLILQEAAG